MKRFLAAILAISLLFSLGFTQSNNSPKPLGKSNKSNNAYFFNSNVAQLKYKGNFQFDSLDEDIEKVIKMNIHKIADLKDGKLYELKLDYIKDAPSDRMNLGYFYVQKNKIYRIPPTKENLNKLIVNNIMPKDSSIVCSEKAIKDSLGKDKHGWHQYIEINGNKCEYHSYNDSVDTGYYESFTWEINKGLIYYQSGYGAGSDSMELKIANN